MTQDEDGDLILSGGEGRGVQLVEGGEDEDGGFSHTGFGLTDNVHAEDGLGDAFVLDFGGVFEAAVDDGAEAFGFEDEVFEAGGVDSYVVSSDICVEMMEEV